MFDQKYQKPLLDPSVQVYSGFMFTIEHEFDATVITLVDEGETPLKEDVIVNAFDDCISIEQYDPINDRVMKVTLSFTQVRDLEAALDLPEGVYRLRPVEEGTAE